jgi:hypothetical protein
MTLTEIKYHDVQESFGMSGPYIGNLEFRGKMIDGQFLADGEKLSEDKKRIVFSKYLGFKKKGILRQNTIREFRILIYDEPTDSFYQSRTKYEALAIESMIGNKIMFHLAFHTEIKSYQRELDFNDQNFEKIT